MRTTLLPAGFLHKEQGNTYQTDNGSYNLPECDLMFEQNHTWRNDKYGNKGHNGGGNAR